MDTVTTYLSHHRGQDRIFLDYQYSDTINQFIKQIEGRRYSATHKKWHLPINTNIQQLNKQFSPKIKFVSNNKSTKTIEIEKNIHNYNQKIYLIYVEHIKLRKLSHHTLKIYSSFFKQFLIDNFNQEINEYKYSEIHEYVKYKIAHNTYSEAAKKQIISALKFYYEQILGRKKMYFNLGYNADIKRIPTQLNFSELLETLQKITTTGDKLLIILAYYFNYNATKISQLKLNESKELLHKIQNQPYLHQLVKKRLSEYYLQCKPKTYLFENKQNNNISSQKIRQKIVQITGHYQLSIIYKKQIENAFLQTNFSDGTKKNYKSEFLNFLKYFHFRHPELIKNENIKQYLQQFASKTESHQNNAVNALKFYFGQVLKRPTPSNIFVRPKRKQYLPEVLSLQEVKDILEFTVNLKHKTLLSLIYSAGLRRSEAQNLTIKDIDSHRKIIKLNGAKGKKDRFVPLSENLLQLLRNYYKEYKPKHYLFEGESGGKYSFTSMAKILKRSARRAGINRNVHLHMLRHSYATHLLEQGTDIRIIQEILGHNSIKTTVRYTHISNTHLTIIKNPFDSFFNLSENKSPP